MVFISYRTYIPCRWLGVVINDIHTLERNNAWYVTASDQVTYTRQWIRIYHNRSMEWHMASLMFHLYLNPNCSIFISTRGEISNGVYSTFRSHVCYGVNLHVYFFYEFRHLRQMSWLDGSIHQYLWMVEIGVVSNHLFLELYLPCAFVCIFISYLYLYLSYDFEWDHMSMHVHCAFPWACKYMHEHICLWIVSVYGYFHALCQRLDVGLWWLQCTSNGVIAVLHWALNVCMCIDEYPSIPSDTLTLWSLVI